MRLIDADTLVEFINHQHVPKFDIETGKIILQMIDRMHEYGQKSGTWIPFVKDDIDGKWEAVKCSNCGYQLYKWQKTKFCSNCGTYMTEKER